MNRHHDIILDFNGGGGDGDELWEVYPLLWESEFNYQRIGIYVNSCNGMLFFFDVNDGEVYICNPTSNESRAIPLPPSINFPPPGVITPVWGYSSLGFDSRSNDYKFMIDVDHFCDSVITRHVELYSLKTNSWKAITDFPTHAFGFTSHCVCADDSIYWLSFAAPYYSIHSLDLYHETHSSFEMHMLSPLYPHCARLVLLGSQLALVAYKTTNSPYCFELWVKTSAHAWNFNKLWDFSLPQMLDLHLHDLFILGFSGGLLYLVAADREVFAYDCAADHLEKLQIRLRKQMRRPEFISYVETTVSPHLI